MAFRFVKRDVGDHQKRLNKSDCTVRALCVAAEITYDHAWNLLYRTQKFYRACGFQIFSFLDLEGDLFGVKETIKVHPKKGEKRLTVKAFAEKFDKGRYVVQVAGHAAAIVDGVLYDTWDCGKKCVYKAWKF